MSKRILVAVWKTEHVVRHSARGAGERLALLAQALAAAHRTAAAQCIPSSQRLRVILVVPEYYFAQRDAATWNGADFCPRSFSEDEHDDIVKSLVQLSRKHPSILFVPGTIAWKQSLTTATDSPTGRRHGRTRRARAIHDLDRYRELLAQSGEEERQPAKLSPKLRKAVKFQLAKEKKARAEKAAKKAAEKAAENEDKREDEREDENEKAAESEYDSEYDSEDEDEKVAEGEYEREDKKEDKDESKDVDVDAPHIAGPVRDELAERRVLPATSMYVSPSPKDKRAQLQGSAHDHMMRNTAYILFNGRVQFKYHKNADYHEAVGDAKTVFVPGGKVGTCEVAGIRFGIEICFDHTMAMLKTGVAQHTAGRGGKDMVPPTIHIVTSDSTDSVEANYQLRDQGYFVHASTGNSSVVQRDGNSYGGVDPVAVRLKPHYSGDIIEHFAPEPRIGRYPLGCWVITV